MDTEDRRVAIVTGASRGIGAEIARHLARDGLAVVVGYLTDETAAKQVVADIERTGKGAAVAARADVADGDAVSRLFDEAERVYGGVDVLVANAGVQAPRPIPIADVDDETFGHLVGVNLHGTFLLLRQAARRLRDGGRVVTISTSALGLHPPGQAVYNACKAATEVLTAALARELGARGITANAVAPGPTDTELFRSRYPAAAVEGLAGQTPLGRIGSPADVARAVGVLVGEAGAWVSGQTIRVNGGLV
ncbi:MAG TPA: SDR family oxidoreductase [Actinophytocola sp.]|jgi:3-oxoacyl-[acyl-carrier protein] reductase|nr:SDR family oxidoreductase [Actinophytocola sp.]